MLFNVVVMITSALTHFREAAARDLVMTNSHASDTFSPFAKYGNNLIVCCDEEDAATHACLHAAIMLGMGLVTRTQTTGDAGNIAALRGFEARIEGELGRLSRMPTHSTVFRKNADGISDAIHKARNALDLLVRKSQCVHRGLKVETSDEAAEVVGPNTLAIQ